MKVLVGQANNGWNRTGFVAALPNGRTVQTDTVGELARLLWQQGFSSEDIRLSGPDDGDHAMASVDRAKFWLAWRDIRQSGNQCARAP